MKTRKIQEQFVQGLFNVLKTDGFVIDKTTLTLIDQQKNTTTIATWVNRYGMAASLGFWIARRYDQIETIVEKYISDVYPTPGRKPFAFTLRFNENDLNGKYNAGAGYLFDGAEENVGKFIGQVVPIMQNKLIPFLEKLRSYEALHEFINDPPEKYLNNAYFFSKDGMTPFRKMIIAKIVNKDYDTVCHWVLTDMIERFKPDSAEKYETYKKIYFELKKELDERQ